MSGNFPCDFRLLHVACLMALAATMPALSSKSSGNKKPDNGIRHMNNYKIAVIGGDGIGPEVVAEGLKVLKAVSKKRCFTLDVTDFDFGGARYLKTGETLSHEEVERLRQFDAIYLGGIGHPDVKPGILEKGILLKLRFDLDQYINLRPVKLYENVETPLKNKKPQRTQQPLN